MDLDTIPWRTTRYPGVSVHFYSSNKTSKRVLALIRMDAGCGYPRHRHQSTEEVLVMLGGYEDELGAYHQGQFVRYEAGTTHAPTATAQKGPDGLPAGPCILLALAHEGIKLLG
jgi:anti-sigma factor ChrR (cupin superfamily)